MQIRQPLLMGLALLGGALLAADESVRTQAPTAAVREGLSPIQDLVGEWRGVGQPKRGSTTGSWQEVREIRWNHAADVSGLLGTPKEAKLDTQWTWGFTPGEKPYRLTVMLPDKSMRLYRGQRDGDKIVVETEADADQKVHRATLLRLNENRFTVLWEQRGAQQSFYQRVAEVAYQRAGTKLTAKDGSGPECVVTGGLGTIPVMYEGKTYYVCCTGCRDAFNDDPAGILAEWEARRKEKK